LLGFGFERPRDNAGGAQSMPARIGIGILCLNRDEGVLVLGSCEHSNAGNNRSGGRE